MNSDPYGAGWLLELQADPAALDAAFEGLLDPEAYRATTTE